MYHFLSGYTAKVAGTERGVTEPSATFSACFGAPFLPLHPGVYARMLGEKIARHGAKVWLVNTGWTGGPYGIGSRMKLAHTRAMVRAALSGALDGARFVRDPVFGFEVPDRGARRARRRAGSPRHLGRSRRVRRAGAQAGHDVPGELRALQGPGTRGRGGSGTQPCDPGSAWRGRNETGKDVARRHRDHSRSTLGQHPARSAGVARLGHPHRPAAPLRPAGRARLPGLSRCDPHPIRARSRRLPPDQARARRAGGAGRARPRGDGRPAGGAARGPAARHRALSILPRAGGGGLSVARGAGHRQAVARRAGRQAGGDRRAGPSPTWSDGSSGAAATVRSRV